MAVQCTKVESALAPGLTLCAVVLAANCVSGWDTSLPQILLSVSKPTSFGLSIEKYFNVKWLDSNNWNKSVVIEYNLCHVTITTKKVKIVRTRAQIAQYFCWRVCYCTFILGQYIERWQHLFAQDLESVNLLSSSNSLLGEYIKRPTWTGLVCRIMPKTCHFWQCNGLDINHKGKVN